MMKRFIAFVLLCVLGAACTTVPITGRKQLALIPNSQMNSLSFSQYDQVIGSSRLSTDTEATNMVKTVGVKIKSAVETYMRNNGMGEDLKGYAWEFNLIDENTVNAWCMPGGKVAFYTGILPVCQDEAGIAVVMGHEVAHAIANHGNERMTQGLAQQLGGVALAVALQDKPAQTQNLFMASYGAASTVGILKYSRTHESEADRLGLLFMAMAGYNPQEAPQFWQRMKANSGGGAPPEFLSTHPSHDTRINDLNKWMPEAMKHYRN